MEVEYTTGFQKKFKKLSKNTVGLQNKFNDKLRLFLVSPSHPGLRLHKLSGFKRETWSLSVGSDLRLLFVYIPNGILFVDIGDHNEVY